MFSVLQPRFSSKPRPRSTSTSRQSSRQKQRQSLLSFLAANSKEARLIRRRGSYHGDRSEDSATLRNSPWGNVSLPDMRVKTRVSPRLAGGIRGGEATHASSRAGEATHPVPLEEERLLMLPLEEERPNATVTACQIVVSINNGAGSRNHVLPRVTTLAQQSSPLPRWIFR